MNENNPGTSAPLTLSPRSGNGHSGLKILLSVIVGAGFLIYALCLFKNISYPLMWADESMTAVGAERVLQFGYPKVHDGRNIFYDLRHSDKTLGIDEKTDAYIGGAGWAHYYFTAPFALLAHTTSDIYLKTAILRIPFAVAGFLGMLLLLWTGTRSIAGRLDRLVVAALFVALEFPCVTLMLHLREVRYYSLQLLFTVFALGIFAAYHLRSSISYRIYAAALICLIPILFLTFSPASLAFCCTICLYLGVEWLIPRFRQKEEMPSSLRVKFMPLVPMLASLALVAPLAWFFKTLYISRRLDEFYGFNFSIYLEHLNVVWGYFARYDVLFFAIAAKLLLAMFWKKLRSNEETHPALRLSILLTIYIVFQTFLVGKIPNDIFTRYFITMQPILALTFALDILILARLSGAMSGWRKTSCRSVVAVLIAGGICWSFYANRRLIEGRAYEITHRYQGVLDYVIPYIKDRNAHPERLVIATNYEETSYIYYLGCRVIVGFLTPDLGHDLSEKPDYISYRGFWSVLTDKSIFEYLLKRDAYEMVRFPVYDYGVNNIPETVHWSNRWGWKRLGNVPPASFRLEDCIPIWGGVQLQHFFGTVTTDMPQNQAGLYILRHNQTDSPNAR